MFILFFLDKEYILLGGKLVPWTRLWSLWLLLDAAHGVSLLVFQILLNVDKCVEEYWSQLAGLEVVQSDFT